MIFKIYRDPILRKTFILDAIVLVGAVSLSALGIWLVNEWVAA
ncbi:integrase [Klebsiella pneumoniae]|nr:integrase [Klebsiella pneumoniae]MQH72508.1 integrase [Escherichia coli]OSZ21133.1 integrase [Klebsiella quasipneumoniae]HBX3803070.1 integrase [Klebsiella pneumoniae subsp. pneumoniae]MBT0685519.1 integrase [Klebsiella pneumoniae]